MKVHKERVGREFGKFDSSTSQDLKIIKSVDISDECPTKAGGNQMVLLDYTQNIDGVWVRLTNCYPNQDCGVGSTYLLSSLDSEANDKESWFCGYAETFGLEPSGLMNIIRREAPILDRERLIEDFRQCRKKFSGLRASKRFEAKLKEAGLKLTDLSV